MADRTSANERRFLRARERIPVKITIKEGKRELEAKVYTADISLTGIFFASEFFLKIGTELELEFHMPNDERLVRARGVIVRETRLDERRPRSGTLSGFAVRFTEYHADAKTVVATAFLSAELDDFVRNYLKRRTASFSNERDSLRDVIVAWEVGKLELQGGELDLIRDRFAVDAEGKIRRRGRR